MKDDGKIPVGFPMGFKFNVEDNIDIDKLVAISQVYHGDKYVIGRDTNYCEKQHYHIHFFSAKVTSQGAMKTFRSNVIKKEFPQINKSFRFYAGKDLPSADPNMWIGYAVKEEFVRSSGLEITEDILVAAKSQMQIKQMKKVKSETIVNQEKQKKEFKDNLLAYVKEHLEKYMGDKEYEYIEECIVQFLMDNERYGSIKCGIIDTYYLMCVVKLKHWTSSQVLNYVRRR